MPCDSRLPAGKTPAQRKADVAKAIERLNAALADQSAQVKINPQTGALAFTGNWERDGVTDACAYRKLLVAGSPALRRALARAEGLAGRKVDPRTVAAGEHSHDGGNTWHKGH